MLLTHGIGHRFRTLFILLFIFVIACRKSDDPIPNIPLPPIPEIVIKATVPKLVYWNEKQVLLDASETKAPTTLTKLFFSWTCTEFPWTADKPVINNATKSRAWLENPGLGQYKFKLTVRDNLGNIVSSEYQFDVRGDTLVKADAGPDLQIYSPREKTAFYGTSIPIEYNYTLEKRSFFWTIIEKPAGNSLVSMFQIPSPNSQYASINGLTDGVYKFQLEVKNEIGLTAYDTMELKVSPDPMKGTTRIYEYEHWELFTGGFEEFITIRLYEPVLFKNRATENFEVRVWDENKKSWGDTSEIYWYTLDDGTLWIYPNPAMGNYDFYKLDGVKAKVQVKYL